MYTHGLSYSLLYNSPLCEYRLSSSHFLGDHLDGLYLFLLFYCIIFYWKNTAMSSSVPVSWDTQERLSLGQCYSKYSLQANNLQTVTGADKICTEVESMYLEAQLVKNSLQYGKPRFDPWVGKIPWRRARQPPPVFLPGESHGQRSLEGYSPWGHKESDMTKQLTTHT